MSLPPTLLDCPLELLLSEEPESEFETGALAAPGAPPPVMPGTLWISDVAAAAADLVPDAACAPAFWLLPSAMKEPRIVLSFVIATSPCVPAMLVYS